MGRNTFPELTASWLEAEWLMWQLWWSESGSGRGRGVRTDRLPPLGCGTIMCLQRHQRLSTTVERPKRSVDVKVACFLGLGTDILNFRLLQAYTQRNSQPTPLLPVRVVKWSGWTTSRFGRSGKEKTNMPPPLIDSSQVNVLLSDLGPYKVNSQ
jgi:hypothetical protein